MKVSISLSSIELGRATSLIRTDLLPQNVKRPEKPNSIGDKTIPKLYLTNPGIGMRG